MSKTEPKRIYVTYNESESGGDPIDPSDTWTSYTDKFREVEFLRLYREPPKDRFFYDSIQLVKDELADLDKLYLAVIRYSTGSTFGHVEGCWHIVGVAPTYKIAELMIEGALNGDGYKPWEGYFERYTDSEIHTLEVV